jgi:hypothetical protein
MYDDKTYSVVGINGYRQGNLTKEQAFKLAQKLTNEMKITGWSGKVRVYYRDGAEVKWDDA